MANHFSALKRARQTKKRTERNRSARARLRHTVRDLRTTISKDPVALDTLGIQELDRERQAKNLESHGDNPELYQNAALMEQGVCDPDKIKLEIVK